MSGDGASGPDGILQAIAETIRTGRPYKAAGDTAGKKLQEILDEIVATQQFALAMAEGDLSRDLAARGQLAGSLKSLQASLRHLTWQAGQIAAGDLTQRVRFMGEFSDSFNAMAGHLAENAIERDRRERELRDLNAALAVEIAERKEAEEALRLANRKIKTLSSITRHDIRNQLLVLRGFTGLAAEEIRDPGILRFLAQADRAAATIAAQIEFTKYYEDLGVNAPGWQDLLRLIDEARGQLSFPPATAVVVDLPPLEIYADGLIGKVFYNLLENSLRHGRTVSRIRFSFRETDAGAEIVYEDDGAGIAPEDRIHLFEKGFGKNTGLGLFLSREILSVTDIAIRETGESGKGARFGIFVPKDRYRVSGIRQP